MNDRILVSLLFAMCFACVVFIGCASLPTQHQQIAAACETIASSVDAAKAAKQAGRITKAQLQAVVDLADPTATFCQPEPADSLTYSDFSALLSAATRIAASPGATP